MKTIRVLTIVLLLPFFYGCERTQPVNDQEYVFLKSYCATVTVGGVVGIVEKCFQPGDTVSGVEKSDRKVTIRIAEHSDLNEGPPSNTTYQEFLDVPADYLKAVEK